MMKILAFFLVLTACGGHHGPKGPAPSPLVVQLAARYASWTADLKTASDPVTGWPSSRDCDGTLWAGEAGADVTLAEYAPGEIHRRPKTSGECYPTESASTVSNDMIAGYLWGVWRAKDLGAASRLLSYGEAHGWKMGQGDGRTVLSPVGAGRLARLVHALGGPLRPFGAITDPCLPVAADYEHHLQTLGILFDGEVSGQVSDACLAALLRNTSGNPKDALFAAAHGVYTGDMAPALALLTTDGYLCPSYVRGAPAYCAVHKVFAAKTVLDRFPLGN